MIADDPMAFWDDRAQLPGMYPVLTRRWSPQECLAADQIQRDLIFSLMPDLLSRTVLDLGCGIGRLTIPISYRTGRVYGVDESHAMLRRAVSRSAKSSARFIAASACHLPFADGFFERVLCVCVLQHILPDAEYHQAMEELARVAAPGATALLIDGIADSKTEVLGTTPIALRSWNTYSQILEAKFRLLKRQSFSCLDDQYIASLWERRKLS